MTTTDSPDRRSWRSELARQYRKVNLQKIDMRAMS